MLNVIFNPPGSTVSDAPGEPVRLMASTKLPLVKMPRWPFGPLNVGPVDQEMSAAETGAAVASPIRTAVVLKNFGDITGLYGRLPVWQAIFRVLVKIKSAAVLYPALSLIHISEPTRPY